MKDEIERAKNLLDDSNLESFAVCCVSDVGDAIRYAVAACGRVSNKTRMETLAAIAKTITEDLSAEDSLYVLLGSLENAMITLRDKELASRSKPDNTAVH